LEILAMREFKIYNLILISIAGLLGGSVLLFSLILEPLNGALTRIGGYSENAYGWREPQRIFPSNLFKTGRYGIYEKPYDVIIVGDSFSNYSSDDALPGPGFWPNYFVNETGLDLISFGMANTNLVKLVNSEAYKNFPPKVVIFEIVERDLIFVLKAIRGDCVPRESPQIDPIEIEPLGLKTILHNRMGKKKLSEAQIGLGSHHIRKNIERILWGRNARVVEVKLDRPGLFSSENDRTMLVWGEDFKKVSYGKNKVSQAVCGLINLKNMVESNGKTIFVGMIAPDKLSIYSKYVSLHESGRQNINLVEKFAVDSIILPRIDIGLQHAVENGLRDIYLPNDTHWGSEGHRVAARMMVEELLKRNIFKLKTYDARL